MEERDVRTRAEAVCAALVIGDVGLAAEDFSKELRQHLGEVVALLPLPLSDAAVESIERGGGSGFTVVLRLVGESEEVLIQTRWKERDGRATVIEASHLSKIETAVHDGEAGEETDTAADETA